VSSLESGYPFNLAPGPTSILAQTFSGTPAGMNLALPAHEIDDTQARLLLDWLVDEPGITRQRGPVAGVTGVPALPRPGSGLVATLDPQGTPRFAALTGTGVNGYFSVLATDESAWIDLAWPYALLTAPPASPYTLIDSKPALGGGALIGASNDYSAVAGVQQGIAYWFGGVKANYANTITVARGSQAVTGTGFLANVTPGMFLFANTNDPYTNVLIGTVLQINSDTSLTLIDVSPFACTAKAGTFQSIRGLTPKPMTGEITTDVTSTTVTGGNTKFLSQGLNNGTWQLYRASDGAFIGKVLTVSSEISITLAANAALSMAGDSYVAIRCDPDYSIINTANTQKVGFINSTYADRQWYANRGSSFDTTSQVWFSEPSDLEGLDLSTFDGNWLDIASASSVNEPIRGMAAAYNGLLIFKETETFVVGGNSPDSFDVRKLEDDGTLCGMSVQEYGGGVIWAGREGINFYDGVQVTNIVDATLGQVWKDTIRTLDPTHYRMWSMVNRDHYFLFLESVSPDFAIVKGNISSTLTHLTVVIDMTSRSVVFHSNVDIRGATVIPASAGRQAWYLVNDASVGHVCDGEKLFTAKGVDAITCIGSSLGPTIYMESKKFDAGDGMRLKRWKMVAMNYLAQGGDLVLDVVLGLNSVGQVATTRYPQSVPTWTTLRSVISTWTNLKNQYPTWKQVIQSVFLPARIRMQKKSQFMSFRIYGSVTNMTDAQIGPYSVAYKLQRVGRV
jgi:hypothetical protein